MSYNTKEKQLLRGYLGDHKTDKNLSKDLKEFVDTYYKTFALQPCTKKEHEENHK